MLAALALHLIRPAHHSPRRVERCATRIFESLARFENWLFPDNARPLDLVQLATSIGDHPVPAQQMNRFASLIFDDHPVSPEILRILRRGSRLKVCRLDADFYSPCDCHVRCRITHKESLDQLKAAEFVRCSIANEKAGPGREEEQLRVSRLPSVARDDCCSRRVGIDSESGLFADHLQMKSPAGAGLKGTAERIRQGRRLGVSLP